MKIDIDLEIDFIRAIQKKSNRRTEKEKNAIDVRNEYITNQFQWTPEVEEKLLLINKRFREEEMRVFKQYRQIEKHCHTMVDTGAIEDFEMEVVWNCWNESHYIKYDDSIEGNPFYTNNCVGNFMTYQHNEEYVPNCHNTISNMYTNLIPRNSPIITEPHCYMFHHLYDHCQDLTWFDIFNIDEFWIEIKVDYQFFSKIK
jgi:hypothetical protein